MHNPEIVKPRLVELEILLPGCPECDFRVHVRRFIPSFGQASGDVVCRRCGCVRLFSLVLSELADSDFLREKSLKPV